ncbi:hypothetical protein AMJ57_02325 [Parcubacteria bacterium SG8_24]|nr:MAG: hypothetical protein AMJ57_02325 [Parcubacteria bacterium SG8_24]
MPDPQREGVELTLRDTRMTLPKEVQELLPEENMTYYESTNQMHCGEGLGGSKFEKVNNIFEVIARYPDLATKVKERTDDRETLLAAGAPESAFLPATKGPDAPEGLPEALYFKVEGVEGRLGITRLADLPEDTRVLVRREKGQSDPDEKQYTPVSFTVIRGTEADMPKVDFATIIVGREGGEEGQDAVWTTHPGAPVRPAMKEFDWTRDLRSPEESGGEQEARVVTVKDLLEKAEMSGDDYVKLVPGDMDETLKEYRVLE